MKADIRVIGNMRHKVGESPLWDARTVCIWWAEAMGREIHRYDARSENHWSFEMPVSPSALAIAGDGAVVVAGGTSWYRLEPGTGRIAEVARLDNPPPGIRMNDGAVDREGRFWVGTMSMSSDREPIGCLYRLDEHGGTETVTGLRTQNGTAFSPDGRTMYLADSHPAVSAIWAFDFDPVCGVPSNRRLLHRPERGRPDGAAVDAEGCYWFAAVDGGRIVRLDPDGKVMSTIDLPVSRPTKPAFGGNDLTTLYVTTMSLGLDETKLAAEPLAGALLAIETGVRGIEQQRVTKMPAGIHARLDA